MANITFTHALVKLLQLYQNMTKDMEPILYLLDKAESEIDYDEARAILELKRENYMENLKKIKTLLDEFKIELELTLREISSTIH